MAAKKPTAAQIKARLANPGERARLDAKYLTPGQRKQRELNTRLNAPVTPGSSMTARDVAHQADSAVRLQYAGPEQQVQSNIAAREQTEKDVGNWFAKFQDDLRTHAQNIQSIGQQGVTAATGLTQAAGGMQAPGGTATPDDANAAKVRAAMAASLGGLTNQTASANSTYADTLANVVAPGQRVVGMMGARKDTMSVRDKLSALKADEGAANQKYRSDLVADEAKNVLAQQALGLDVAKTQTAAQQQQLQLSETSRHNKASEKNTAASRQAQAQANAGKVNQYGYTNGDWARMSTAQRQDVIRRFKNGNGGKPKSPYLAPGSQTSFKRNFDQARTTVASLAETTKDRNVLRGQIKNGRPASTLYVDPKTRQPITAPGTSMPVTDVSAAKKINPNAIQLRVPPIKPITDDVLLSAVLDTVLDGHLSPATIRKLHKAGYKVNSLGVSTKRPSKMATQTADAISSVGNVIGSALGAR
jgi:hypothetical protein